MCWVFFLSLSPSTPLPHPQLRLDKRLASHCVGPSLFVLEFNVRSLFQASISFLVVWLGYISIGTGIAVAVLQVHGHKKREEDRQNISKTDASSSHSDNLPRKTICPKIGRVRWLYIHSHSDRNSPHTKKLCTKKAWRNYIKRAILHVCHSLFAVFQYSSWILTKSHFVESSST